MRVGFTILFSQDISKQIVSEKVLCNLQYASENVATQLSRNLNRGVETVLPTKLKQFSVPLFIQGAGF